MVDQRAPASWPNSSEVVTSGWLRLCPAAQQDNECRDCRHVGISKLKQLNTVNIEMFRHPKYYKELRKLRNKSGSGQLARVRRRLRQFKAGDWVQRSSQASSDKHQASSTKLVKPQATSSSPVAKASSFKPQASSAKIPDPGKSFKHL